MATAAIRPVSKLCLRKKSKISTIKIRRDDNLDLLDQGKIEKRRMTVKNKK